MSVTLIDDVLAPPPWPSPQGGGDSADRLAQSPRLRGASRNGGVASGHESLEHHLVRMLLRARRGPPACAPSRSSPGCRPSSRHRKGGPAGRSATCQERNCGCVSSKCRRLASACFCSGVMKSFVLSSVVALGDDAAHDRGGDRSRSVAITAGSKDLTTDRPRISARGPRMCASSGVMSPSNRLLISTTSGNAPGDPVEKTLQGRDEVGSGIR